MPSDFKVISVIVNDLAFLVQVPYSSYTRSRHTCVFKPHLT
jgi:hypothetical protein